MKKIRIAPCLLLVCMIAFFGGGCSLKTDSAVLKQSQDADSDAAAVQADASTAAPIANDEEKAGMKDEAPQVLDDATPAETASEILDTPDVSGSGAESDIDTQRVLFGGGQAIGKKSPLPKDAAGSDILLNFDEAELSEVVREFADMLGINYMLDPTVNGKVTIHSAVPIDAKQLYQVFLQVLDTNGLTAVQVGELYQIGKSKDASKMPLLSRIGRGADGAGSGQRIIMQIVPLKFISSKQMIELITPFISVDGTIFNYDQTNVMILVDKEINILKALKLVEVFDVDVFDKTNHAIYRLEFVDAKETVKVVQELVSAYGTDLQKEAKIISVDRLNVLIVFSKKQKIFDVVESFLKTLDVPTYNVEPQIYVYSVRNGRADELSTLLGSVFSISGGDTGTNTQEETIAPTEAQQEIGNPFAVPGVQKKKGEDKFAGSSAGSGSLKGDVKITADEIRNALIIEAIPSDYFVIEKILSKLDVLPRQVLIEVTIAEIKLDDETNFGMEWNYPLKQVGKGLPGTSVLSASVGEAGLSYLIGETDRWTNTLTTMAKDNKVNILSSPSVLASDNKEATINIATESPVVNSVYDTTGSNSDTRTTNVQYRNTGVILTVTPHINEFGLVSMDINQEVSEVADGVNIGGITYPAFFKRSVKTSLTVNNEQTIVIGGLIKEDESKGSTGVPILKDIPLLKFLFGKVTNKKNKSELILLITPRVIVNLEDVNAVTEEFKSKVKGIVRYSPK